MSFTSVYRAGPQDRETQKRYEADIGDAYDDWLSNKEIHLIPKPSMGLDYKQLGKPQIVQFLSSLPQYIKITFTLGWKKTNMKRTQVWSNKKRVEGKFILCVYRVNCTIMKVQHFQKPQFVLSKPKDGKKGRVIVMPMSGGKGNRKTIMGIVDIQRIEEEDEYTDRPDQEVVSDYFLDIIEEVWKPGYSEKPTVDLRLLQQSYKQYLDYKYELTQFRKIMKKKGDSKSQTLGSLPTSQRETTPPASPNVGESSGAYSSQVEMEDSSNLFKDLEEKNRLLTLIRAEVFDQLAAKDIDDQDMHYVTDMAITIATLMHSVRDGTMGLEKCNMELDECYVQLMNIVKSRGLELPSTMITEWDRLRKRFFEDESQSEEPSSKRHH